jgi:hypothetical protein
MAKAGFGGWSDQGGQKMRTLIVLLAGAAALAAPVSNAMGASPSSPRADSRYEIWCTTSSGQTYLAKRVDASAIQPDKDPGGQGHGHRALQANNPYGEHCVEFGPITP